MLVRRPQLGEFGVREGAKRALDLVPAKVRWCYRTGQRSISEGQAVWDSY